MTKSTTLIVGLGNPILMDDRVGIEVGKRVQESLAKGAADFLEVSAGGLAVLDAVCGYRKVILIDAIQTGARIGTLHEFKSDGFISSMRLASVHGVDFFTALETGRKLGMKVPEKIRVYAVEVKDPYTFSETMTPELADAVLEIVEEITLKEFGKKEGKSRP